MAEVDFETEIRTRSGLQPTDSSTIHVNEREDGELIRKTSDVAVSSITPDTPRSSDASLAGRVHPLSLEKSYETLGNYKNELEKIAESGSLPKNFPNLAWEAIKAGLLKEKVNNDQIQGHIHEARKMQSQINLILDLNAELVANKTSLSDRAKEILNELKEEHGIDLWKGNDLDKEGISQLKSLANSRMDKLRSDVQILFTTKIQVLIQQTTAIMEVLREMIRQDSRLKEKANRLPGQ